jgi:hypothetical protein
MNYKIIIYVIYLAIFLSNNVYGKNISSDTLFVTFLGSFSNDTIVVKTNINIIDSFVLKSDPSNETTNAFFVLVYDEKINCIICEFNGKSFKSLINRNFQFLTIMRTESNDLIFRYTQKPVLTE